VLEPGAVGGVQVDVGDGIPGLDQARVVAEALKTYGMMLADNGSAWYLSGAPDERWDDDALRDLRRVTGADFEAVDVSSLMVDPDSGRTR